MSDKCDEEVYERGTSLGIFIDMTKEQAERYCRAETERTKRKHDWYYYAGRVHVLALPPKKSLWQRLVEWFK